MNCYTYILKNQKGDLYIGQTNNLQERIERHNRNRVTSTKKKGPWKIVWRKAFNTKSEAMKYERYLKSLKNKKYLEKIIAG
jgi:putative endonuclease